MQQINIDVVDIPKYIPDFLSISYSKIPNAGLGIFANRDIQKGTFLGNYMGEIIEDFDSYELNDYCFDSIHINKNTTFIIDGFDIDKSNFARFLNCCYNKDVQNVLAIRYTNKDTNNIFENRIGNKIDIDGYIFLYAKRNILQGEELLYDYGEQYREKLNIKM